MQIDKPNQAFHDYISKAQHLLWMARCDIDEDKESMAKARVVRAIRILTKNLRKDQIK